MRGLLNPDQNGKSQKFTEYTDYSVIYAMYDNLVFWGPRSFQFDLEMNINICCMRYIIREDYWRP